MSPPLQQRLKALFSEYDSPLSDYRFVMYNNAGSALVIAIAICAAVWWGTHLVAGTFICLAALTLLLFALLTVCMVIRYAFWIPAVLVAVVNGTCGGGLLWYVADRFYPLRTLAGSRGRLPGVLR